MGGVADGRGNDVREAVYFGVRLLEGIGGGVWYFLPDCSDQDGPAH